MHTVLAIGDGSALFHTVKAWAGNIFLAIFVSMALIQYARGERGQMIGHFAVAAVIGAIVYTPSTVIGQLTDLYAQATR